MTNKTSAKKTIFELHADIGKTLSNSKRLEIIDILRQCKECAVSDIARKLNLNQANVSQHLLVMKSQNIVTSRRDGSNIYYSLANTKVLVAYDALKGILKEQLEKNKELIEEIV